MTVLYESNEADWKLLARGKVDGCSLGRFEDATGLKLMDANGLRNDLPPITTFLNRLLALTIDLQNVLFTAFEQLLTARIEGAVASGTYDVGLETLRAESLVVTDRRTIYDQRGTGAETRLLTVTQRQRNHPPCVISDSSRSTIPANTSKVTSTASDVVRSTPASLSASSG